MKSDSKHRLAFEKYLEMGPGRSLKKLHVQLISEGEEVSLRTLEKWSVKYTWQAEINTVERRAFENYITRKADKYAEIVERSSSYGLMLQEVGLDRLTSITPEELDPSMALKFLDSGVAYETRFMPSVDNTFVCPRCGPESKERIEERRAELMRKFDEIEARMEPVCRFDCEACNKHLENWRLEHVPKGW
jgi:hypothetical protein